MSASAALAYKNVSIASASPVRILDEVYAQLLRDCRDAVAGINAGDVAGKAQAIAHALSLAAVLSAGLERHRAPEICENLTRLYRFVQERLMEASATMRPEPIAEAVSVILDLRSTFAEASVLAT